MKIKSLLLGSAAVMVAVSGARAADVIVVEPEPVEYVRVCDAYGAGWFYIPGTETCLRFDGDVRIDYRTRNYHGNEFRDPDHDARYRGRLNVRANNETEYGTLASRIRFNGSNAFGGGASAPAADPTTHGTTAVPAAVILDWAVISLAGFRIGYADNYWSTAGGYGLYNARNDGFYDYAQALFLDYTWAANGWSATVGIESQYIAFNPTGSATGTASQPDVYAGLTYSGGGWYLAGILYYDNSAEDFAYKFRADYDMSSIAPGLSVGGWYMADDGNTDYVHGHAWGLTAQMNLAENWVLFAGYSDYDDQTVGVEAGQHTWNVGLRWNLVPGLYIQGEYFAYVYENETSAAAAGGTGSNYGGFNLRIVRSF